MTLKLCDIEPLVAIIVIVYDPAGVEAVVDRARRELTDEPGLSASLALVNDSEKPGAEGEASPAVRDALPVKPRLFRMMVVFPPELATKLAGLTGPADIVKSGPTVTIRVAE